jgi:hypothetical protein
MDPYLEDPGLWPDVHHRLISIASELLGERIRPKYYVRIEERVYISDEGDPARTEIMPDLPVIARPGSQGQVPQPSAMATLEVAEPVEVTTLLDDEIHEARLEVIDREQRQVVTVIEVLSPTNKVAGSRGQASYQQKRQEIRSSLTNWVEIDLLRRGVPFVTRELLPPCEYIVHVSWKQPRLKALVWPIRLHQRLPVIPIPLRLEDPDAPLDLQAVLTTAYDRAGYDLDIDYRRDPVHPLPPEYAAWAHQLLQSKGLR